MYKERGLYVFPNNGRIRRFAFDGKEAAELSETTFEQQLVNFLEIDLGILKKVLNNLKAYDNNSLTFKQAVNICGTIGMIAKEFCMDEPVYSFLLCTEFYLNGWNVDDKDELINFKDYAVKVIQQVIDAQIFFYAVIDAYCRCEGEHFQKVHYACLGKGSIFDCRFEEIVAATDIDTNMFQMTIPTLPFNRGYRFETLSEYIWYIFVNAIEYNKSLSQCEYCGHFFTAKTKKKTRYCDRVRTDDGRTCKQIGPAYIHKAKLKNSELLKDCDRAVDRNYRRWERFDLKLSDEKQGKDMTHEEYADWLKELRRARSEFYAGKLSENEFRTVIHRLD